MSWTPSTAIAVDAAPSGWMPSTALPAEPQLKGDIGHQAAAGLLAFGQGGMPVFDEAGAGAGALLEKLGAGNVTGGNAAPDGASLGDIYDKRLANIRGVESSFSAQHPVLDPSLRVAGGIASIAALPGAAEAMAARPVATGAAYGAAQGFTGADGGVDERLGNAALGGAIGAGGALVADKVINPIISKAAPALQDFITSDSSLPTAAPVNPLPLKGRETGIILKNLAMGGVTPQDYAAALRNSGTDDFAGEVGGDPLRMLAQNQAKIVTPDMQTARAAMRQRLAAAPARAQAIVEQAFGPEDETNTLLSALDVAKGAESTLYGAAADGTVPKSAIADVIETPAGQKAVEQTITNLQNKKIDPLSAGFVKTDNGFGLADEVPVQTGHEISKALGDMVDRNPITGKTETAAASDIEDLRKQVVDALRKNSPEFNAAQDNAAQVRQAQDALSLGRQLAKQATGENADDAMGALLRKDDITPFSQAGFKQGLIDTFQNAPLGTGNPIAGIAKQRTVNRASELVGQANAEQLAKNMLAEKLRMEFAQRGIQNSSTAETLAPMLQDISMKDVAGKVLSKISDALNAGSNQRLSQALYATTPQEKSALAAAVLRASGNSYTPANQNALAQFLRQQTPLLTAQSYGALSGGQQ